MGRLILNVLLSFAQFEREMISERTRDKIAAARRKGKWVGGQPILGYNADHSKLMIHEEQAKRVRAIFALYLEHRGSLRAVRELERRGWLNKTWQTRKPSIPRDLYLGTGDQVSHLGLKPGQERFQVLRIGVELPLCIALNISSANFSSSSSVSSPVSLTSAMGERAEVAFFSGLEVVLFSSYSDIESLLLVMIYFVRDQNNAAMPLCCQK
jgi:hypothetical protein